MLLAFMAAGCTHHSQRRYVAPAGPTGASRIYRAPEVRRPVAFVPEITLAGSDPAAAADGRAAALRVVFADAAARTGLFDHVVSTGEAGPAGAVRIEIELKDALTESWFYAMFWGQQSEEYRVDLKVRLMQGEAALADFSDRVVESDRAAGHVFMVYFPVSSNLSEGVSVRARAMSEVVRRFDHGLAMASPALVDLGASTVTPAPMAAAPGAGQAAEARAVAFPIDASPRGSLHTVELSVGSIIHESGAVATPSSERLTHHKSGPSFGAEYGARLGRLLPAGPLARWLPEARAGGGFWRADSTVERCSDVDRLDCETIGTDDGAHWGLDARLTLRETFQPIDYWGIYVEAGLGVRVEQDETEIVLTDSPSRSVVHESADTSVRTRVLRTFGLGLQFGPDHYPMQFLAQARFAWHSSDDYLSDVQLGGALRFNL